MTKTLLIICALTVQFSAYADTGASTKKAPGIAQSKESKSAESLSANDSDDDLMAPQIFAIMPLILRN